MRTLLFAAALLSSTAVVAQSGKSATSGQDSSATSSQKSGVQLPDGIFSDNRSREVLAVQVMLDRSRHSPGVIDGLMGGNTRRAIRAYRAANDLQGSESIDNALMSSLKEKHGGDFFQSYAISKDDVDGPFVDVPSGFAEKAKLEQLAYETPLELLAEKFHMDQDFLKTLNPQADFSKEGTQIVVVAPGDQTLGTPVSRVVVNKAKSAVQAFGKDGKLLATYPATIGSDTFPSPSGSMKVLAVAAEPTYHFDPEGRSWGPDRKLTIAAGPNNPVGGTWIDLSKEGYGIHGSPDPQMVGKRTSHGCVRLTNWDAEELAKAVSEGTEVAFE